MLLLDTVVLKEFRNMGELRVNLEVQVGGLLF